MNEDDLTLEKDLWLKANQIYNKIKGLKRVSDRQREMKHLLRDVDECFRLEIQERVRVVWKDNESKRKESALDPLYSADQLKKYDTGKELIGSNAFQVLSKKTHIFD